MTDPEYYKKYGRLTDPGKYSGLLQSLPDSPEELAAIGRTQTVHFRMLSQWHMPKKSWKTLEASRRFEDMLKALQDSPTGILSLDRPLEERLLGACINESIFFAGLLKSRGILARIRVGYFTGLYQGKKAWEFRKNVMLYERNTSRLAALTVGYLSFRQAKRIDRTIEHWICEHWDNQTSSWRLIDFRGEYVEAYGFPNWLYLPREHFEYQYFTKAKFEG